MAYIGKVPTAVPLSTNDLADNIITSAKISDGTITASDLDLTDNYDFTGTVTGAGGVNTPAFEAYRSATVTLSNDTFTKVEYDTEVFDTDSMYDHSTNYRFTPTVAGKYNVYAALKVESDTAKRIEYCQFAIRKNGSTYQQVVPIYSADNVSWVTNGIINSVINFNGSSDYVEMYVRVNVFSGSPKYLGGSTAGSFFGAYKIIE